MRWQQQQQNVNSFSWALPSATKSLFHYQFWMHCGWMVVQSQVLPSPLLPPPSSSFKSTKSNNRKEIRKRRERIAQGACDNNNYYNHRTVIITWICAAAPRQLCRPSLPYPPSLFLLSQSAIVFSFIYNFIDLVSRQQNVMMTSPDFVYIFKAKPIQLPKYCFDSYFTQCRLSYWELWQ